jgi:hypothetical protein
MRKRFPCCLSSLLFWLLRLAICCIAHVYVCSACVRVSCATAQARWLS